MATRDRGIVEADVGRAAAADPSPASLELDHDRLSVLLERHVVAAPASSSARTPSSQAGGDGAAAIASGATEDDSNIEARRNRDPPHAGQRGSRRPPTARSSTRTPRRPAIRQPANSPVSPTSAPPSTTASIPKIGNYIPKTGDNFNEAVRRCRARGPKTFAIWTVAVHCRGNRIARPWARSPSSGRSTRRGSASSTSFAISPTARRSPTTSSRSTGSSGSSPGGWGRRRGCGLPGVAFGWRP